MKNLVFLLAFFICVSTKAQYNPALHTVTNKPLGIAQAVPTDARSFYYDPALFTYRPYMSTAEVLAYLSVTKYRVGNFPIFINVGGTLQSNGTFTGGTIQEYWFKDGTANSNLVLKSSGGTTTTITTILDSARFTNRFRNLGTPTFPLIDLNPPGIIPGTYLNPVVTVDSFRVISITNGGSYGTGIPDKILTGGYVSWGTGLTYNVTAATYDKNYKPYSSPSTSVTLTAADPTLDRVDVIAVDTNNSVVVIPGTPAVNPVAPQANLNSQIQLTTITVKANTTSPTNVFITTIHDENNTGEWNGNGFGISPNFANTNTPAHLFKAVSIPNWSDGNAITFTNGATVALNNYTALTGYIKLDAAIPSTANIAVAFLNDQNQITQAVTLTNPLGFDKNIVGVYQPFIVPMGNFIFQSGYLGNTLKFFLTGTSVTGLEMDFIQLQAGSINNGSSPYVTDAFLQNDSLFVNKNNINTFRGLVTGLGGGGTTNAYTKPQTDSAIAANKLVQINSDWNALAGVAQILNKPTIPTTTSQLTNNSGFITSSALSPYSTSAQIAAAYQPIGSYLTAVAPYHLPYNGNTGYYLGGDSILHLLPASGTTLNGTGLVRMNGTTVSYDNSTYLTSYTETDPVFLASVAHSITSGNISTWNSALQNITGLVTAGTNTTVTGSGTVASPYVVNASSSGGSSAIDTTTRPTGLTTLYKFGVDSADLKGRFLGTLYQKNSWTSGADFTLVGSPTIVYTGNKVNVSGGSKAISAVVGTGNSNLTQVIRISSYGGTMLEKYKASGKFKVDITPGATTYGFSIGTYSISVGGTSNAMAYFNMSTATGTGTVSIIAGTSNTTVAISGSSLTFSQNDYILLTLERTSDKVTATARNMTAGGQVSTAYAWDFTSSTNVLAPNTSNFAIGNMGGSFVVDSVSITSNETKGAPELFAGDSKFEGYATPWEGRIVSLFQNFMPGAIASAGQGDRTSDLLNHLPEIIALAPKQVILLIGRNDIFAGITTATWEANIASIVSQLQAAGISVILLDGLYETGVNQSVYTSYIQSTYPNNYIATYLAGSYASALSSDGIHPSYLGARTYADVIYNSPLVLDLSKYPNGKPQNTNVNSTFYNGYFNGTLYDLGRTYTPDVVNGGDIVLRHGSGITAAFGVAAQKTRIEMSSGITFRSYVGSGSLAAVSSFAFLTGRATTGTQTTATTITNGGLLLQGAAPVGFNAASGDIGMFQNYRLYGATSATAGDEGAIIPFTSLKMTELRNYNAGGKIKLFTSSGVANSQIEAFTAHASGAIGINQPTESGTAQFEIASTTKGMLIPRVTNTQRDLIVGIISGTTTSAGTGQTSGTYTVTLSGGGAGTGAIVTVSVNSGIASTPTIVNTGTNYSGTVTGTIAAGGTPATFSFTLGTPEGTQVYSLTDHTFEFWNGTVWKQITTN